VGFVVEKVALGKVPILIPPIAAHSNSGRDAQWTRSVPKKKKALLIFLYRTISNSPKLRPNCSEFLQHFAVETPTSTLQQSEGPKFARNNGLCQT
jgi:hypothetical protein